ncbi:methyltransferase-like protein 7B-like [Dorcoceras hygrometricum]|uniref:Methyltransferase-like protein 7B-like n=1 Tax=Dorcoceras hygrometricum TaxID=472368 RepID=A0A2Z6ZYC5_9LAMI|nr:methyltransferase-like protein 7B-like [Dorcoceras hygrometricum]
MAFFLFFMRILQGYLQVCKPRSLCFLEGPEAGIHLLGMKFKKWPGLSYFGLNSNVLIGLEHSQLLEKRARRRTVRSSGLQKLFIVQNCIYSGRSQYR